ncbi:MAG TPA: carboxypeptidase regulatory-like domain-containing protein [bacterium (Candidatus Stahlbacteria)]|nr:carboxypeptidase regulatory-like domain-containing protein [Candidatus Stahlbacteria bacterium]
MVRYKLAIMNKTDIVKNLLTTIFLSLFLGIGCLKKQHHEILKPRWPRYKFGGIVLDSITKNPVNGCIITVIPHELVYSEDCFTGAVGTTDSCGTFLFPSLPVGDYWINFEKESYCPYADRIMVYHRDSINYRWALLKMSDIPDILVLPLSLNISVEIGKTANCILYIYNQGDALPLKWQIEESSHNVNWLTADPKSGSIPSRSHQSVNIKIDASEISGPGNYETHLLISSNDPDEPTQYVSIKVEVKKQSNKHRIYEIE